MTRSEVERRLPRIGLHAATNSAGQHGFEADACSGSRATTMWFAFDAHGLLTYLQLEGFLPPPENGDRMLPDQALLLAPLGHPSISAPADHAVPHQGVRPHGPRSTTPLVRAATSARAQRARAVARPRGGPPPFFITGLLAPNAATPDLTRSNVLRTLSRSLRYMVYRRWTQRQVLSSARRGASIRPWCLGRPCRTGRRLENSG